MQGIIWIQHWRFVLRNYYYLFLYMCWMGPLVSTWACNSFIHLEKLNHCHIFDDHAFFSLSFDMQQIKILFEVVRFFLKWDMCSVIWVFMFTQNQITLLSLNFIEDAYAHHYLYLIIECNVHSLIWFYFCMGFSCLHMRHGRYWHGNVATNFMMKERGNFKNKKSLLSGCLPAYHWYLDYL